MKNNVTDEHMLRYEGLVKATARRFEHWIHPDFEFEDICQELRVKVFSALSNFDSSYGYPEEKHVYGVVANRIKDLIKRKRRPESSFSQSRISTESFEAGSVTKIISSGERDIAYESAQTTDAISELPHTHQSIAVNLVLGFTAAETCSALKISSVKYRLMVGQIKSHLAVKGIVSHQERKS